MNLACGDKSSLKGLGKKDRLLVKMLGSFFCSVGSFNKEFAMSKKMMLLGVLSTVVMAGGCEFWKTAHMVGIHVLDIAAGVDGLNNLLQLGLPAY